jgi:hypothetical protein
MEDVEGAALVLLGITCAGAPKHAEDEDVAAVHMEKVAGSLSVVLVDNLCLLLLHHHLLLVEAQRSVPPALCLVIKEILRWRRLFVVAYRI